MNGNDAKRDSGDQVLLEALEVFQVGCYTAVAAFAVSIPPSPYKSVIESDCLALRMGLASGALRGVCHG